MAESMQNNLKSYIQDLKKVTTNNKQKRQQHHQNSQSFIRHSNNNSNYPQSTKGSASNISMMYMNNPMLNGGGSNQASQNLNISALGKTQMFIQSEQDLMMLNQTQIISPQTNHPVSRGKLPSHSTNITPQNRRQNHILSNPNNVINSKPNILSNKAMAYLNSKKTNNFLKNYEEALNSTKFIPNNRKNSIKRLENTQSNISFNEKGKSQQKSRSQLRNQTEISNQCSNDTHYQAFSAIQSPTNNYVQSQGNITHSFQQLKHIIENNFNSTQQLNNQPPLRPQKEVVIRKQSSKSLIKANEPVPIPSSSSSSQNTKQHQRVLSQVTTSNNRQQDMIVTNSTAAQNTNDTSSVSHGNAQNNQRIIGSHFIIKAMMQNTESGNSGGGGQEDDRQRALMKKIHTLGNSLGGHKKSLNISQQFGDSILNDMTLAKTGKIHNLNISSLIKQNLLDDDGIEDLHFYFVSFNQHKQGILKQHENVLKNLVDNKNQKTQQNRKSNFSKVVNMKANVLQQQKREENKEHDKTIESVEEEELY